MMKTSNKLLYCFTIFLFLATGTQAQFLKKLSKKAQKAAERTVERRVEQETAKKTDQALDSILEPGSGNGQSPNTQDNPNGTPSGTNDNTTDEGPITTGPKTLAVYSKFDFVPGDKPLYHDDFEQDFIGDFPSKWNTNGSGEVVNLEGSSHKWYAIANRSITVPNLSGKLPEDFTVEFDLKVTNLSNDTSSGAKLGIYLSETPNLSTSENNVLANLNFCQYIAIGVKVDNNFDGDPAPITNTLQRDLRQVYQDVVHVSIAVNKNRYRLWLNETKIVDLPQFVVKPEMINHLKFSVVGINEEKNGERLLISNLKINEGGVDLRRKLLAEGKISTNGILFNSGSADILPQSMGIIRQISQVLTQDTGIKLRIVGHTDADGSDENNLKLSQARAESVKKALISVYGIAPDRLMSEGKGESVPVGDNNTAEGKAQNRRVEFIKL